ncbi:MAG: hypothetical protein ACYC35_17750 [Pirellulales bacterium]|jgi:hypothetical protein
MKDPIVEEVHEIRKKLWNQCGGDLDRYLEYLKSQDLSHPGLQVSSLGEMKKRIAAKTPPAGK